jgi:endoglycosylceramidase
VPDAPDRLRISADRARLIDGCGRTVVLRGFVTITNGMVSRGYFNNDPIELDETNFAQMESWGCNAQQIRLEGCRLGVFECEPDPAYLDKLDRWVTLAAAHGIYTIMKMTIYDVPSVMGLGRAFDAAPWEAFWTDPAALQDRIDVWRPVWERFSGRPEILGYDLINEPSMGTTTGADASEFAHAYLYPFYRQAGEELRKVDREAAVVFQPARIPPRLREQGLHPYVRQPQIGIDGAVYSPHYYADLFATVSADQHREKIGELVTESMEVDAPLVIGEYGLPNQPGAIPPPHPEAKVWTRENALAKAELFDEMGLSALRIWYINGGTFSVIDENWAETERLDYVMRPYPQRTAGRPVSWRFDHESRRFAATLDIDADVPGETVITVPRHLYPDGAIARCTSGVEHPVAGGETAVLTATELPAGITTVELAPA